MSFSSDLRCCHNSPYAVLESQDNLFGDDLPPGLACNANYCQSQKNAMDHIPRRDLSFCAANFSFLCMHLAGDRAHSFQPIEGSIMMVVVRGSDRLPGPSAWCPGSHSSACGCLSFWGFFPFVFFLTHHRNVAFAGNAINHWRPLFGPPTCSFSDRTAEQNVFLVKYVSAVGWCGQQRCHLNCLHTRHQFTVLEFSGFGLIGLRICWFGLGITSLSSLTLIARLVIATISAG